MSLRKNKVTRGAEFTVALAGNPNVGKSTVFNSLTGLNVHTGNWSGKTVGCQSCVINIMDRCIELVDVPGAYSLFCHSEEERIAGDYISFGGADLVVVVCDATALSANLNLALQIIEIGRPVVLCLNLMDEARRAGITIDTGELERRLGVPVVPVVGRSRRTLMPLVSAIIKRYEGERKAPPRLVYDKRIEEAIAPLASELRRLSLKGVDPRWLALRLIDSDGEELMRIGELLSLSGAERASLFRSVDRVIDALYREGISGVEYRELIVSRLVEISDEISRAVTHRSRRRTTGPCLMDRILCGRVWAYPCMLLMVGLVFFITLFLANLPSAWLSSFFSASEGWLIWCFDFCRAPRWVSDCLILGVYRTVGQVISVMLPPVAIFFPLFSLMEDSGYLPRIAYNLDRPFAACRSCGKQALTMCMGFGCNAVGIVGCRIIDSERERRLAAVTNCLVPCNGRLPMLISLITVFLILGGKRSGIASVALLLMGFVLVSVLMTFLVTRFLSVAVFPGEPSAFTLELPPYRRPKVFRVIYRSLRDKCLDVMRRAVITSAPMGLIIWLLSRVIISGRPLTEILTHLLDPIGGAMGLDGVILLSFILGLAANETVLPIMISLYLGAGGGAGEMAALFAANGWSLATGLSAAWLALFHSPCLTSLVTVYKETRSVFCTFLAFLCPVIPGILGCFLINLILG